MQNTTMLYVQHSTMFTQPLSIGSGSSYLNGQHISPLSEPMHPNPWYIQYARITPPFTRGLQKKKKRKIRRNQPPQTTYSTTALFLFPSFSFRSGPSLEFPAMVLSSSLITPWLN